VLTLFATEQREESGRVPLNPYIPAGKIHIDAVIHAFQVANRAYTLVLDSFQAVREHGILDDVVRLSNFCPHLHIKVLTRIPTALESLPTYKLPTPIRPEPTCFFLTPEESSSLIEIIDSSLSESERKHISKLADGNILLLRMLLAAPARARQIESLLSSTRRTPHPSLDLFNQLFPGLPFTTLDAANALVDLAVPALLPEELAEYLVGETSAAHLLELLEHDALGWWEQAGGKRVFHLHVTIRTLLRTWFAERPKRARQDAHMKISVWMSDHGFLPEAIIHAGAAENAQLVVRAIRSGVGNVFFESRPDISREITKLPVHLLVKNPVLCIVAALSYNANPDTAELAQRYFRIAILMDRRRKHASDPAEVSTDLLRSALFAGVYRVAGMLERSRTAAQQGWDLATHLSPALRREHGYLIQSIAQQRAITELLDWDLSAAASWLRKAVSAAQELPASPGTLATSYGVDALVAMEQGDIPTMRRRLESSRTAPRFTGWSTSFRSCPEAIASARIHLSRLDTTGARAELHRMDAHWDTVEFWPFRHLVLTPLCLLEGNPLEASIALDRALALARDRPALSPMLRSELQLDRIVLDIALGRPQPGPLPRATDAPTAFWKALLEFQAGHNAQSVQLANRWAFEKRMPLTLAHGLILLRAEALRRMGRDHAAIESLDRAFSLSQELDDLLPLTLMGGANGVALMRLWRREHPDGVPYADLSQLPQILPTSTSAPNLTKSEMAALRGIADGLSASQIAARRNVSVNTVKSQIQSLYRKLEVRSRRGVLAAAGELKLLE
jgi:LuxR family maltose regulon positive regulatory protein